MARLQFGFALPVFASPGRHLFRTPNWTSLNARTTLELGVHAEALGFDSLWVADHLMLGADEAILEGWTTLSALAGATRHARLGLIHQAHYFRPPAITAKMAATLDQLSGGRFTLFYDFGRQPRENHAYGLPYPDDIDLRARDAADGARLIRTLWSADHPITVTHGRYSISEATCTPLPIQRPHPPIWFGEIEPVLLDACAEFGQGWNTAPVSTDELTRRLGLLESACARKATDFNAIEKSVELQVAISHELGSRSLLGEILARAPDRAEADPDLIAYIAGSKTDPPAWLANSTLIGSPGEVTAQLRAYIDAGATHFVLWFLDAPDRTGLELFAGEVAPSVRASQGA